MFLTTPISSTRPEREALAAFTKSGNFFGSVRVRTATPQMRTARRMAATNMAFKGSNKRKIFIHHNQNLATGKPKITKPTLNSRHKIHHGL